MNASNNPVFVISWISDDCPTGGAPWEISCACIGAASEQRSFK
jgi:hypothetical protein